MTNALAASLLKRLFERLEQQEDLELELKAAKGGLPKSLWPTVSAFANTQGGWIVLGVDEREDPPSVVGITNPHAMLQELHNLLRNKNKISYPVCGPVDATVEKLGDKSVIVIRVPATPRRERPVYVNSNPYEGTYVRRHAGDFHCSKAEVDRMMREALDAGSDSAILPHLGVDDLDAAALRRYRQRFQTRDPASPCVGYDDRRFLQAMGAFRRDPDSGGEGLTVAGLLLLGLPETILQWRVRHLIDYRLVSDEAQGPRWDDRVAWEGGLLQAFETIYPKLIEGLPSPFTLEGAFRVDQGPRQEAIREALVNLLVHADYAESDASLIKRMPEGYAFRNPGNSRVLENDLLAGDRSDPRNPTLVRMFRLVGLADEAGTGMPKIIRAWQNLGFQMPEIEVGTERYEFSLNLRHAHMLSDEDRAWLQELGDNWSEAEQIALVIARHEGEVDNLSIRRVTGQHMADVTRVLGGLRDRGLLQMIGMKRGARYQLGAGALDNPEHVDQFSLESGAKLPQDSDKSHQESSELTPKSSELTPKSSELGASSEDLTSWTALLAISAIARERRYLRAAIRDDLILHLCARRPLSLRELAQLLDRDETTLRDPIRSLLAAGRLHYLYPDRPTHRRQKYVAANPPKDVDAGSPAP